MNALGALLIGAPIALCLSVTPAQAAFHSGHDILRRCTGTGLDMDRCFGYLEGIADAMGRGNEVYGRRACIPAGVTSKQLRDLVILNLTMPRGDFVGIDLNYEAGRDVAAIFAIGFPCR